jgi:hypothetical protein
MKLVPDWFRAMLHPSESVSRPTIQFRNRHRECVEVEYRDPNTTVVLDGEFVGPKWKQLNIAISDKINLGEQTLDNLVAELRRQNYDFVIYRLGEEEQIPEAERQSALHELTVMGYQVEVSPDRKQIRLSLADKGTSSLKPRDKTREHGPQMMKLIKNVRGVRRSMHILRKSDSAVI